MPNLVGCFYLLDPFTYMMLLIIQDLENFSVALISFYKTYTYTRYFMLAQIIDGKIL